MEEQELEQGGSSSVWSVVVQIVVERVRMMVALAWRQEQKLVCDDVVVVVAVVEVVSTLLLGSPVHNGLELGQVLEQQVVGGSGEQLSVWELV